MDIKNPMLQQAAQAVEAKVPPDLKNTYQRIILAGEKFMYSPKTHEMMMKQMSGPNPAEAAGEGIAKLFAILMKESKGTLRMEAAIPAMTVLLCDGLDFLEQAGRIKVDEQLLAAATEEMGSDILQMLGMTPDKLQQMMAQRGQPAAQPAGIVAGAQGG
jgi:hypothetical protein